MARTRYRLIFKTVANEYRAVWAILPALNGEVAVWDVQRRKWFWIDSLGNQSRTWDLQLSSGTFGTEYTDLRGNVYIGQPKSIQDLNTMFMVRVDSGNLMRDSVLVPFSRDPKWVWVYKTPVGGTYFGAAKYAPYPLFGIDARGRMFAATTDSSFVLVHAGQTAQRRLLPSFGDALSRAELDSARKSFDDYEARGKQQGAVFQNARPPAVSVRPQIEKIVAEMNGGLAVVRVRSCDRIPDWRAPGTRAPASSKDGLCPFVERFDADGRRLHPFTINSGDDLRVVRGDTAWVVRTNADGLQRVIELVVPRS